MNKINKLELLAPAQNPEYGIAAINHGADAVYIGAPKFGARAAAGNSLSGIEKLITYAHKFNAKVYTTVNTVIYNNELQEVQNLITTLYNAGIDAVIFQDMAILEMELPPVPLFASTQTHNYSLDRILKLEKLGIERVILARELSLKQIEEIHKQTKMELEFFIHGALCVSFSGQCYFSQAVSGRSANRGECSQSCRMMFSLIDNENKTLISNKYLLSLKDLNLSNELVSLIQAGVTSFKIEGRLKDLSYVKNVTGYYRKKLDEIIDVNPNLSKSSSGEVKLNFEPDLNKTFNRGYTTYFVKSPDKNLTGYDSPKSKGEFIGKVKSSGVNFIELETDKKLINGDGICYLDYSGDLKGMYINKIEGSRLFVDNVKEFSTGTEIYRNHNNAFNKILNTETAKRKIGVTLFIKKADNQFSITAVDEDSNSVELVFNAEQQVNNSGIFPESYKNNLAKSGNTIFSINNISIEEGVSFFMPISELNQLRRNLLEKLETTRTENYLKNTIERARTEEKLFTGKLDYTFNVTNNLSKQFYKKHGAETVEPGFEISDNHDGLTIMTTKYCVKRELSICPIENKGFTKDFTEPLYLKDEKRKYKLEFNCKDCIMLIKY